MQQNIYTIIKHKDDNLSVLYYGICSPKMNHKNNFNNLTIDIQWNFNEGSR